MFIGPDCIDYVELRVPGGNLEFAAPKCVFFLLRSAMIPGSCLINRLIQTRPSTRRADRLAGDQRGVGPGTPAAGCECLRY